VLEDLERAVHLPVMVPAVIVMGRDGDNYVGLLCGREQANEIGYNIMFGDALPHHWPRYAFRAHDIDLWVDYHQRGSHDVELHIRLG
jgi:hypothetical protein